MTYRSVIRFQVRPGREREFEAAFERAGMMTRPAAVAGFLDAELCHSIADPTEYLVVARWQSEEAYRDWQQQSLAEVDPDALDDLFDTIEPPQPGQLYRVLDATEGGR